MALSKPRGIQQWLMFGVLVAIVMAVIFRVPQVRSFVTGS